MKKILMALYAGLAISVASMTFADTAAPMQSADQTQILNKLKARFPNTKVDSISKAEMGSLYEVRMGNNIAFVDKDVKYFLFGHMFDMATQQDLTQAKLNELDKVDFAKLPLKDAIKITKGNGKRVMAVFTDPECPFCQRLEQAMSSLDNYTMYVFLYPIAELHPAAQAKAVAIWCSKDRAKAYHEALTTGIDETKIKTCDTPIGEIAELGRQLRVAGTPTLIRSDGVKMPGFAPSDKLSAWLDQASQQKAAQAVKIKSPVTPDTKTARR